MKAKGTRQHHDHPDQHDRQGATGTGQATGLRMQQKDLVHGWDVVQEALTSAGFEVTIVQPGAASNDTNLPASSINEPGILGIVAPDGTPLSLTLNITP